MNVVVGIDLGTQGVRVIAVDQKGEVLATSSLSLSQAESKLPAGWHEQNVEDWWQKVCSCLHSMLGMLPNACAIDAVCVTSTSGTVVTLDSRGEPVYPAIMYNDERSQFYVPEIRECGSQIETKHGYAINATFALSKIVWLARERADIFQRAHWFISPTDFIIGRLCGGFGISDYSNMLKSCYDLVEDRWPSFIQQGLNIPLSKFPQVVSPGAEVGKISPSAANACGLPQGTPIVTGATDGVASHIASGAVELGSWNSTLGTTLVVKGTTDHLVIDPQQRIYCHKHPDGGWMPGGASNVGGEWISCEYPDENLIEMDASASQFLPTNLIRYPLVRTGERFPFRDPKANGFLLGTPADRVELFAASMEGLAMVERLAYELFEEIGAEVGDYIYVTGGGSRSEVWLRIRASVLQRSLLKPRVSETAMGAALLAASRVWFGSLAAAVKNMVQIEREFFPDSDLVEPYREKYQLFLQELLKLGYLPPV